MPSTPGWYFCLKCGAELPADARFCPVCGHSVGGDRPRSRSGDPLVEVGGDQLPLASVGKRFGALIVDVLVFGATAYVLVIAVFVVAIVTTGDQSSEEADFSIAGGVFGATVLGTSVLTMLLYWGLDTFGWSPGKAATGIRTVRLDGRRPGVVHGLVRYSMRTVGLLAFGLGYFWAIWDERNQTWHDKLARTVVVRARPLQDRFPDRRPQPLVTARAVWWLAILGSVILTASVALNVWYSNQFDAGAFDIAPFDPQRFEDDRRVDQLPDQAESLSVRFESRTTHPFT